MSTSNTTTPTTTGDFPSLIHLSRPFLTSTQVTELQNETGIKGPAFTQLIIQAHGLAWSATTSKPISFPIRTMATALILFQRALLYNNFGKKIPVSELTIACLLVSSKIEDTPKRSRDLIQAVYSARNGPGLPPLSSSQIEEIKVRILGLERQILETSAFDFRITHPFKYIVKFCKQLQKPTEQVGRMAWCIGIDLYCTMVPLKYPSHTTALGCVILAAKLQQVNIFPIDSNAFRSPRPSVNAVLEELLDYYIDYLMSSQLYARFGVREVSQFMTFRMEINRELTSKPPDIGTGVYQHIRDTKISDKGSVRYIIEWEKDHVKGEIIG